MSSPNAHSGANGTVQFGRVCKLLVSNLKGNAIDLSQFRIKFLVKKTGLMSLNTADIVVYNLSTEAVQLIQKEFTTVILQAGYGGNYGVLFIGGIKQFITGRESATDTFINLICADGDLAYNFSVITQTIAAGSTPSDHVNALLGPLAANGVGKGYIGTLPNQKLPRAKVLYGNVKDHLAKIANNIGFSWSIQDGNLVFLPQTAYLPDEAVVLTSKTGMIGTPQQTIEGVRCRSLLNPNYKANGRVQINEASIAQYRIDPLAPGSPANTPVQILYDGFYFIYQIEHRGDTRDLQFYSDLELLTISVSSNPLNSVQGGTHGP